MPAQQPHAAWQPGSAPARPALLTLAMIFVGFGAFVTGMMVLMSLLMSGGTYTVNGQEVGRAYWLTHVVPPVAAMSVIGVLLFFGLLRHQRWVRPLVMATLAGLELLVLATAFIMPQPVAQIILGTLFLAVPAAVCYWVFYRYGEVVEYYRRLAANRPGAPQPIRRETPAR